MTGNAKKLCKWYTSNGKFIGKLVIKQYRDGLVESSPRLAGVQSFKYHNTFCSLNTVDSNHFVQGGTRDKDSENFRPSVMGPNPATAY